MSQASFCFVFLYTFLNACSHCACVSLKELLYSCQNSKRSLCTSQYYSTIMHCPINIFALRQKMVFSCHFPFGKIKLTFVIQGLAEVLLLIWFCNFCGMSFRISIQSCCFGLCICLTWRMEVSKLGCCYKHSMCCIAKIFNDFELILSRYRRCFIQKVKLVMDMIRVCVKENWFIIYFC